MTKRAAIILAGGKGQRFQTTKENWQDKALTKLDGKPLLIHTIENVQDVVDETIIVVNEEARKAKYQNILANHNIEKVKIVADLKTNNLSGPFIAILTGLEFARAEYCLTIPADMPLLKGKVAEYLFNEIKNSYIAVPMWPNGSLETLLMVLERSKTLKIAHILCQLGRDHPDGIIRGAQNVLFVSPLGEIKVLDPELKSFVNINCQDDLCRLQPRQGQGEISDNLRLNLGKLPIDQFEHLLIASLEQKNANFLEAAKIFSNSASNLEKNKLYFWSALSHEYEAKSWRDFSKLNNNNKAISESLNAFLKAATNYHSEAATYEKNRCYMLAQRANADKSWCKSQIKNAK